MTHARPIVAAFFAAALCATAPARANDLVLVGDTTLTGDVDGNVKITNGTLTVAGQLDGNIEQFGPGSVVVLPGASIDGDIKEFGAGDVVLAGNTDGNIEEDGAGSVLVAANAVTSLDGNINLEPVER